MSNLLNPLEQDMLYQTRKPEEDMSVQTVSRAFYDRLLTKDPMTIYVITDTGETYKGDIRIDNPASQFKGNKRLCQFEIPRPVSSM